MPHSRPIRRAEILAERLDALVATFDVSTISPDPLELVRRFDDPLDQEVAGIIAAAFAYGRADIVVRNGGWILERMTPSPFVYLRDVFTPADGRTRFAGFSHRFHKTRELLALLSRLATAVRRHGSLGALFLGVYDASDRDIASSLTRFVDAIVGESDDAALHYLLTSPRDGSACKRMNLFLRWMVRRTSPDLGLWSFVDPSQLVIPLDTHVHRIAAFLGMNGRRTPDWKAARMLTDRLARLDPADPVRYDFALCRLGILDLCSRTPRRENCEVCVLGDVCRLKSKVMGRRG